MYGWFYLNHYSWAGSDLSSKLSVCSVEALPGVRSSQSLSFGPKGGIGGGLNARHIIFKQQGLLHVC